MGHRPHPLPLSPPSLYSVTPHASHSPGCPGRAQMPRPRRAHQPAVRGPGAGLDAAARALSDAQPNRDALTLQIPGDGQRPLLKAPLDRIEDHSIAVDTLSIHNPDLDDVFFALTGLGSAGHDPPGTGRDDDPVSTVAYRLTDSLTMRQRIQRHSVRNPTDHGVPAAAADPRLRRGAEHQRHQVHRLRRSRDHPSSGDRIQPRWVGAAP